MIRIPSIVLFSLFFLLGPNGIPRISGQGYNVNIQHFSVKDGLSNREVFDIHQDSRGFIWIATKYGLNRYDGKSFKWWTKEKNGLSSNEVHHILEDGEGYLWVLSVNSWFHLDRPLSTSLVNIYTGKVISLEEKFGEDLPFQTSEILTIVSDEEQTLFISTTQGALFYYRPEQGFQSVPLTSDQGFHLLFATSNNTLWGYWSPGDMRISDLVEIDLHGEIIQTHKQNSDVEFLNVLRVGLNGEVLYTSFGDQRGPELFSVKQDQKPVQHEYLSLLNKLEIDWKIADWSQRIFYQADQHFFWFKSHPHFFVFHPEKGMVYNFQDSHQDLIDADIHTVYFDKTGIVWIGTAYGLYELELKPNPFTSYLYMDYQQYKVHDAYSCRGIWADEKNLFVNTYKGRMQIEPLSNSVQRLPSIPFTEKDGRQTMVMFFPLAVLQDQDRGFWFSDYTLAKWGPESDTEQYFNWNKLHTYDNNIWSMYQDQAGKIWVGTEKGLGFLDTTKGYIQSFPFYKDFEELNNSFVHAFVESKGGHVWLGTSSGLYAWKPEQGILDRYWTGGQSEHYLPHDNVLHVYEDTDNFLWLATGGGGLIKLHPATGSSEVIETSQQPQISETNSHFRQFTIADGLSNNNLYAVYGDEWDNLWMSSDYGIIQFNKNTFRAKAYLPKDGVTHQEYNRISHFQAEDGSLYFGGLNGVTAFHPKDFHAHDGFDASLQITNFQQFDNKSYQLVDRTNELLEHREIILKPGDRLFRLQFALLDFQNTDQIRYAWKMESLDVNWNYIRQNFIRVSGLPYGNYTLKIKGQAANGQWSEQELHIPVVVLKPFYLKTWFLLLGALLFLFSGPAFYKWRTTLLIKRQATLEHQVKERTETIEQQKEELLQLDKLKTRFFANVSHELRTPLTLILGPLSLVLNWNDLPDRVYTHLKMIQKNGQQLLGLVNEILDLNKLEANKLELHEHPVVLYQCLRRILSSFESYAQFREIEFTFRHDFDRHLKILLDESKFEKILHNLLSNAFKFTPRGGEVSVVVEDLNSTLRLQVIDNGSGIHPDDLPHIFDRFYQSGRSDAPAEGGTGIGLALSCKFAQMFGGQLTAESDPESYQRGQGSTFSLEFPKKEIFGSLESQAMEVEFQESSSSKLNDLLISSQKAEAIANSHQEKILIVEDSPDMQTFLQFILSPFYTIQVVENGQEALDVLNSGFLNDECGESENFQLSKNAHHSEPSKTQFPDLIISDVMMPVMDGFAFLQRLKIQPQLRHIPVILLSARAGREDKMRGLRIGVDDYLTKPFEVEELLVRVSNLLHNHRERQLWMQEQVPVKNELTEPTAGTEKDLSWLAEFELFVEQASPNPNFSITQLAKDLILSERQLQRKLKQLTGLSPIQYLREIRLKHARQLLENRTYSTVSEVAYAVGFSDPKYFSRSFRNRFGKLPSAYL